MNILRFNENNNETKYKIGDYVICQLLDKEYIDFMNVEKYVSEFNEYLMNTTGIVISVNINSNDLDTYNIGYYNPLEKYIDLGLIYYGFTTSGLNSMSVYDYEIIKIANKNQIDEFKLNQVVKKFNI